MMSTVIGGAMLPHAPQFFTMPDTEDKEVIRQVREVAADIGKRLRALEPEIAALTPQDLREGSLVVCAPAPIPLDELEPTFAWLESWDLLDETASSLDLIDRDVQAFAHQAAE